MEYLAILLVSPLLSIPAWMTGRKRNAWFLWDYATVFYLPLLIWHGLTIVGVGVQSLSNSVIEPLIIALCVPVAQSLRVFGADRLFHTPLRSSLITCAVVCLVLPLVLRIGMPGLSE